jgi:hypothetical protein
MPTREPCILYPDGRVRKILTATFNPRSSQAEEWTRISVTGGLYEQVAFAENGARSHRPRTGSSLQNMFRGAQIRTGWRTELPEVRAWINANKNMNDRTHDGVSCADVSAFQTRDTPRL